MASGGRKVSALSVTYEETCLGSSWFKNEFEGLQPRPMMVDNQSTAIVPGEVSLTATELCDHLQPENLYEDTHQNQLLPPPQQASRFNSHSNQELEPEHHSNGCLSENQHPIRHSEPTTNSGEPDSWDYSRGSHNTLYVLEDRLRHRVNVSIEDFRAHIQEVFYEQFGAYRESAAQEPTGIHTHMCEEMERSCDSVCTNQSSIDSGVSGVDSDVQAVNYCLIKLQMCAAAITSNLQRAEYSIT